MYQNKVCFLPLCKGGNPSELMRKVKYFYNTQTLKYEKLVVPFWTKVLRVLGFISAALVTSFIIVSISNRLFSTPGEAHLKEELAVMREQYKELGTQLDGVKQQVLSLQHRDDGIYRVIFEAHPIPDSARAGKLAKEKEITRLQNFEDQELVTKAQTDLADLEHRIQVQNLSYDQIDGLIKNKERMIAHIPAIQPISNRDLTRIASGFGYRIDPIYKTVKFHPGLDFAAPTGTPIYATGDGVVSFAGQNGDGYGNHVIIDHGFGYETLYGHMSKIKARRGQHVIRGQVIGYVGSTGKSTGPHCHYEVIKNGIKVDPVYYFYNDLSPEQFERLVKIASANNQSLD